MDYVEAFQNLRANNKYGRRSPHKAVLMLTVIELYERNVLSANEIVYDDTLKSMFLRIWNKVLPAEPLLHSEAYLPFWNLQCDSFWHIVPVRGKEDVLSLMRDTSIKPSEAKLEECVRYVELDEDLYFLMTLPSGRSSLKRVLLETYTNLNEEQIEGLAESSDNAVDYSVSALSDFEKILSNENKMNMASLEADNNLVQQFQSLNEDIQIVLNLQYYSFLKSHRNEREMFKEVFPTVYDLLDKIINHPINKGDIAPSLVFTLDNFLSDLKISMMSEDGSIELIDKIGDAIDKLRGSVKDIEEATEQIIDTKEIELCTSDSVEEHYDDKDDAFPQDYIIENHTNRCCIIDNRGVQVFSSSGNLIRLNYIFYGISFSDSLVSMTIIQASSKGKFSLGRRIISAHKHSPLYRSLDKQNYLKQFKAVEYDSDCDEYYIQVDNRWYGSSGFYADLNDGVTAKVSNNDSSDEKVVTSGSRSGKPWTHEEEELITSHFNNGIDINAIASIVGRSEGGIKARLAKLGLIEYNYGQDDETPVKLNPKKEEEYNEDDFKIDNTFTMCSIYNNQGEKVFSSDGKLKYLNGKLYRFNLKDECFTLKSMLFDGSKWKKGAKKIVAYPRTDLFRILYNAIDYCDDIEDIDDNPIFEECRLKVAGEWYCYNGTPVITIPENGSEKEMQTNDVEDIASQFTVKIGETLKIFPSQMVGKVVDLRIDKSGHRKIVVQAASGTLMEIYDSKYLYQKQPEKAEDVLPKKKRARIKDVAKESVNSDVIEESQDVIEKIHDSVEQRAKKYAVIGCWIKWKPTGDIGKVISFFRDGQVRKMIIRTQSGDEKELYDNPSAYDVIFGRGADVESVESSSTVIDNDTHSKTSANKKVRIGDIIKIKSYNARCKVIRIEKFAASFTKLIVEFDDGRQDWIIDNPDLYTIL